MALLIVASVAAACGARESQVQDASVRSEVTVPANWYEVRGGSWQVPNDVLARIAGDIPAEAVKHARSEKARPLSDYIVQYQGQTKQGRRVVSLSGACDVSGTSPGELRAEFYLVDDGGNCFFQATYDPASQRFTEFLFNGWA